MATRLVGVVHVLRKGSLSWGETSCPCRARRWSVIPAGRRAFNARVSQFVRIFYVYDALLDIELADDHVIIAPLRCMHAVAQHFD